MDYTENLTLALAGDSDLFDESYLNANFEKIDAAYAELSQRSGGSAPAVAAAVAAGVVGRAVNAERPIAAQFDLTGCVWEQGYYSNSNGNEYSGTDDIRTPDTLTNSDISANVIGGNQLTVKALTTSGSKMNYRIIFYRADGAFVSSTGAPLILYGSAITVPQNAAKLKLCLGGVGALSPSDLANCKIIFFEEA